MFSWLRRPVPIVTAANTIAEGTKVQGSVEAEGDFQLNGVLDGTMTTKGRVVIGERGSLLGNLRATSVLVLGHLEGDVECTDRLEIGPNGKILGDVTMKSFAVQNGGIFRGSSRMAVEAKSADVRVATPAPRALLDKPRVPTLPGVASPSSPPPPHATDLDAKSETPPAASVARTRTLPPPGVGVPPQAVPAKPPAPPLKAVGES
jgi:cytoskeletal protein CcmA (bactofilin family)